MKIQIDLHTLERAEERGTNEEEIKDVITIRDFLFRQNMVVQEKPRSMILIRNDMVIFISKREWK
jgi:hypothetical protein